MSNRWWLLGVVLLGPLTWLVPGCDAFADPFEERPLTSPSVPFSGSGGQTFMSQCPGYPGPVVSGRTFSPVLYAWLSDQELERLKETGELLTPREQQLSTVLDDWQREVTDAVVDDPINTLKRSLFDVPDVRHTWPYPAFSALGPWGSSMQDTGGIARHHLLRIVLHSEALLLVVNNQQGLIPIDGEQGILTPREVVNETERIAVVLAPHLARERDQIPMSGAVLSPTQLCSLGRGLELGNRSFLLVNSSWVKNWSVGSDATAARLQEDGAILRRYLEEIRAVGQPVVAPGELQCQWFQTTKAACFGDFSLALSVTQEPYSPTVSGMVSLIDFLNSLPREDEFLLEEFDAPSFGGAGGASN